MVESPTYLGALQAWNAYGAEYVAVPSDKDGMITDELEEALRTGPKFIYVLPNFQNPTGVTLPLERRIKIVELADRYGVPIIEDDPYGQLRYEGEHIPPVVVLDDQFRANSHPCYHGNVIYLSTFSKILSPGLRLAWIIAPPEVIRKLVQAKQGSDLHTATFIQLVAHEIAKDGFLYEHIKVIRKVYGERRSNSGSNGSLFSSGSGLDSTGGGLFLWGTMPDYLKSAEVLKKALEQKVAFVPGAAFLSCGAVIIHAVKFLFAKPDVIYEDITLGKGTF
jgi:2-aminoadipate transaminase